MVSPAQKAELLETLERARISLISAVRARSEDTLGTRARDVLGNETLSVKEQVAHLAELESSLRVWVRRALDESRPRIDLDANRGAVAYPTEAAGEHAIESLIEELERQRDQMLGLIHELDPSEFMHTLVHPGMGEITILELVNGVARHDREHAAFIAGERPKHSPRNLTAETIPNHRV